MKRAILFALAVAFVASGAAFAAQAGAITLPPRIEVGGQSLTLSGHGIRKKLWIQVYTLGLYLPQPMHDANQIIQVDQPKAAEMVMMRDVGRKDMQEAIRKGFEKNVSPQQMATLQSRLNQLLNAVPDLKEGERLIIAYSPGRGTFVSTKGAEVTIPGKDFADALFSVWLGRNPVDDDLKKALVAGR